MNIVFADDEIKKDRIVDTIKNNPGINTYQLYAVTGINQKAAIKLIRELKRSDRIYIENGHHGSQRHYVNS